MIITRSWLWLSLGFIVLLGISAAAGVLFFSTDVTVEDALTPLTFELVPVAAEGKGEQVYSSSTILKARWSAPDAERLTINLTDTVTSAVTEIDVSDAALEEQNISQLKSGTLYEATLTVCQDALCLFSETSGVATASTSEEYWQLEGDGQGWESMTSVAASGVAAAYVMTNPDSDELTLYTTLRDSETHTAFITSRTLAWDGLTSWIQDINNLEKNVIEETGPLAYSTYQTIPLIESGREIVRLFMELHAEEAEPGIPNSDEVRLASIDSMDGFTGAEFSEEVTVRLGIEADGEGSPLTHVRQSKIGWPDRTGDPWNTEEDAFMFITGADSCGATRDGLFFASWYKNDWIIGTKDDGCAIPIVERAHGPVIVHLGGDNYKLYFEHRLSDTSNQNKPFHILYASGAEGEILLSDWEDESESREVHFLWPDGTLMNLDNEMGLGDHQIFMPTHDLGEQYMLVNLGGLDDPTWERATAGIGVATLINP